MKQIELGLPEYLGEVSEEIGEDLLHARCVMLLAIDQLIYVLGGAESVRPDLHLQRDLQLVVTKFEDFLQRVFLVKLDREGDLGEYEEFGVLGLLENLVEVVVQGLRYTGIFQTVVVFGAEVKNAGSSLIVEVDHLRVLSESIQYDLADIDKEYDTIHQLLLVLYCLVVAISK